MAALAELARDPRRELLRERMIQGSWRLRLGRFSPRLPTVFPYLGVHTYCSLACSNARCSKLRIGVSRYKMPKGFGTQGIAFEKDTIPAFVKGWGRYICGVPIET
jgi:hypothetical protein